MWAKAASEKNTLPWGAMTRWAVPVARVWPAKAAYKQATVGLLDLQPRTQRGLPEKQTSIHFSHVSLWLWGILGLFHLRTFHLLLPALAVYCTHWVVSRVAHHNRCMPQPQFFSNANILKTRPSKSAHKHVLWTEKVHNKSSVYSHGSRENCHHISYCSRLRLAKHVTQSFLGTN